MSPSRGATRAGGDLKSQAVPTHWLLGFTLYFFQAGEGDLFSSINPIACTWHQHCRMLEGEGCIPPWDTGWLYGDKSLILGLGSCPGSLLWACWGGILAKL